MQHEGTRSDGSRSSPKSGARHSEKEKEECDTQFRITSRQILATILRFFPDSLVHRSIQAPKDEVIGVSTLPKHSCPSQGEKRRMS